MMPFKGVADRPLSSLVVNRRTIEKILYFTLDFIADLVTPILFQLLHPANHHAIILAGQIVQQPLQIAGNKDIHRGRHGSVEISVAVVNPGANKVGQHPVGIGSADKPADRQPHAFGVIAGENITEITSGHHHVDRIAQGRLTALDKIGISRNIINNLRH